MIPLNISSNRRSSKVSTSGGAVKGINTKTYSEFLDLTQSLNTENYLIEGEGSLIKRKGWELTKDITGSNALQTFRLSDDMWLLQYGTQISSYYEPTDTVTALETLDTSDDISAVKFGDYIFYTNGSSVIRYATFDYGSNLITDMTDFEKTRVNSGNTYYEWYVDGAYLRCVPNGVGSVISESTSVDLSPTIGNKYNVTAHFDRSGSTDVGKIIGFFDTITSTATENVDTNKKKKNTNNVNLQIWHKTLTGSTVTSEVPTGTIDGVNTVFTLSDDFYQNGDVYIDTVLTTGCIIKGRTLTLPSAPSSTLTWENGDRFTSGLSRYSNFSIAEQDPAALTVSTLSNSPVGKKLFIYDSRLVIGNMVGDEGFVQYCERYTTLNQEDIPTTFNIWTGGASPLEPNDPGNIALRELGRVNDFTQLGSQLVIFYENGKAGYRITDNGVNQIVPQDFAYMDNGGFRAINTGQGVFYTNEAGLWTLVSGGVTSQPFSTSENNPSRIFSDAFIEGIDFTDSDMIHDFERRLILVTAKETESYNDVLLWYNYENKSFGKFTGWTVKNFMRIANDIYVGDSSDTRIYKLYTGTDDNGSDISTELKQEVNLGIDQLKKLKYTLIKGEFPTVGTEIAVNFDVYDDAGVKTTNYFTGANIPTLTSTSTIERWKERTNIRQCQRIVFKLTNSDQNAHTINYVQLGTQQIGNNNKYNA